MNFYDVLQIPQTATKYEIKKAYHKLAVQYHPDKCNLSKNEAEEKFYEIKTAYDVLYDDHKRQQYDSMTNEEQMKIFDVVKKYFKDIRPEYSYIYDVIIDILYSKNENEFKDEINEMNIKKIFGRIGEKIKNNIHKKYIIISTNTYDLDVKLKEKYENTIKIVKVGETLYDVPTWNNKYVIEDTCIGQVVININTCDDKLFKQLDDHDLLLIQKVSLGQYLYGDTIKIHHINNEIISFTFDSCLEKKPIFCTNGKGLICNDNYNRGSLYIYIVIEGINWIDDSDDNIAVSYANTIKETIKIMFPPICN
jgi:DnaJ-class molecular chaperone